MKSHFELTDDLFELQFQTCTLDPELFSHEAHLRLAWIHIRRYGVEQAIENVCGQLLVFVTSLGAASKYNKTLTVAAVKTVNHFMNKSDADDFSDFIHQYPGLKFHFKKIIRTHYGIDVFTSPIAKQTYLEPDLLPFP